METALIIGLMFALLALGLPIAFAIMFTAIIFIVAVGTVPYVAAPQNFVGGIDSFILLAVPMFILAAKVMNSGKITDRIFNFAATLVRHIKGGLAHVNILASLIFSGMSGSAVADAAGLGEIEIRAMRERGYDAPFAATITAASSVVGPIFPPSVPFIVFGSLAGVSIAELFLGGAIPALVMAVSLMIAAYAVSHVRGYPSERRAALREIATSFGHAFFPLLSPVIVLGAIIFGITTPTEAAVIAVLYSLVLGFAYRTIRLRDLPTLIVQTGIETGVLMLLVGAVSLFTWIITLQLIPQALMSLVFQLTESSHVVMALIVLCMLFIGLFMNPTPGLLIAVPFILPLATQLGVDGVHLGVVMVLSLAVGLITPPVGLCLFIVARIARIDVMDVVRETAPFVLALIGAALLVAFYPPLTLLLPEILFR